MSNDEQEKINAEHIRKAEANRNAEYVDLWKKTEAIRARKRNSSKGVLKNGSRLISRKNNEELRKP